MVSGIIEPASPKGSLAGAPLPVTPQSTAAAAAQRQLRARLPAGADPPPQPGEARKCEGNAELCQLLLGSRVPLSSALHRD